MVFCDRHYGGINYPASGPRPPAPSSPVCIGRRARYPGVPVALTPMQPAPRAVRCPGAWLVLVPQRACTERRLQAPACRLPPQIGGVGAIPEAMADGIQELGSYVEYKANVKVGRDKHWGGVGRAALQAARPCSLRQCGPQTGPRSHRSPPACSLAGAGDPGGGQRRGSAGGGRAASRRARVPVSACAGPGMRSSSPPRGSPNFSYLTERAAMGSQLLPDRLGGSYVLEPASARRRQELAHACLCAPGLLGALCSGKTVVSNATRWDTFEGMIGEDKLPESGEAFQAGPALCTMCLQGLGCQRSSSPWAHPAQPLLTPNPTRPPNTTIPPLPPPYRHWLCRPCCRRREAVPPAVQEGTVLPVHPHGHPCRCAGTGLRQASVWASIRCAPRCWSARSAGVQWQALRSKSHTARRALPHPPPSSRRCRVPPDHCGGLGQDGGGRPEPYET